MLQLLIPATAAAAAAAAAGVSLQANTQALMSLAGFDASDVLLTAWDNDTFRPCHYVAVDRARQCLVGAEGSGVLGHSCAVSEAAITPVSCFFGWFLLVLRKLQ
jgi:hypothetical protein